MADKIIEIGIKSNIPEVTQDFKELNKQIQDTNDGLNSIQSSVDSSAGNIDKVTKATQDHSKAVAKNTQGVLENGGAVGILNELTGGLASTVKDAAESTSLFSKEGIIGAQVQKAYALVVGTSTGAMKTFKLALAGTGIGLIIIAIGLLIQNFDKVKEAVLKFIPQLKIVGDIFSNLIDGVTDFIGVTSEATRELEKMVNKSEKLLKKNQDFIDTQGDKYDDYTKRKIQANIDYAKKVEEINKDETRSEEEKIKILKAYRDKADREIVNSEKDRQAELSDKRKEAAEKEKEQRDKLIADNKDKREDAYNDNKKHLDELLSQEGLSFKERRDLIAADRALSKEDRKKYNDEVNKDEIKKNEELAKIKRDAQIKEGQEVSDIIANAKKANADALLTEEELRIQTENERFESDKSRAIAQGFEIEELEKQHLNNLNNIKLEAQTKANTDYNTAKQEELKIDESIRSAKETALNTGLDILSQFAGKNKAIAIGILAVQKGLAIADVVVGASKAVAAATSALASVPAVIGVVPNPMYAVQAAMTVKSIALTKITAATSIASILASTITSAKGISGGGGGAAAANPATAAGGTPPTTTSTPVFDLQQRNNNNNLSGAQAVTMAPAPQEIVVKAIVSETEISKSQQTVANIKNKSEL
jgi:hypothetical protein